MGDESAEQFRYSRPCKLPRRDDKRYDKINHMRATSLRSGVTLIEILIGMIIVVIASVATLTYFAYGMGNVGKSGNRRAALERARERLEQLMAVNVDLIKPDPIDFAVHIATCSATTCTLPNPVPAEWVSVDNLSTQKLVSTVQCVHDRSAGTPDGTCDVLELTAKVWFIPGSTGDNDFSRVHVRTLRTS